MTESADAGWAKLKEQRDSPELIRAGLQSWLRERLRDGKLTVGPLNSPAGTGVANDTLLFDVERASGAVEGYVARLAAAEPLYLDYDIETHYRMYATMNDVATVPTPGVVGYEPDPTVAGAPFFVMDKITGSIPSDAPSWASQGFIVDAAPAQRRHLWESTVRTLAELHRVDSDRFSFLRTGTTPDGVGDCLDYWQRALRWAAPQDPVPLADEVESWLHRNRPTGTALSWGDSRLPNVVYRDYSPVGLLDWDLVSLAGPQADLAWWIIMTPAECQDLDGIGSHREFIELWEDLTGWQARDLHWFLVFGAYRLAGIMAKLLSMFVAQGRMPADMASQQLRAGFHVQLMAGLLDLTPPRGVTPVIPDVGRQR